MKQVLAFVLYNSLLSIFLLVDFSKWLMFVLQNKLGRVNENQQKRDNQWAQKFGFGPFNTEPVDLIIHCASVGEVASVMPLLQQLCLDSDKFKILVTTNTLTGKHQLFRLLDQLGLHAQIQHRYLPIDLPWLLKPMLRKCKPKLFVIMEVELWPNLIINCKKQDIPLVVINARMTDKTKTGYSKLSWLAQPMLQSISHTYTRNDGDTQNYQQLGVEDKKLSLVGNIKFDIEQPSQPIAEKLRHTLNLQQRQVLIGGSTHEGEEALLLECYLNLKHIFPNLILLIAPRHPHRFDLVNAFLIENKMNVARMSLDQEVSEKTDILLADEMGKLSSLYGVGDIVFVGGSFVKVGGHNPIEAAAFGKPILMGQYIYNNPEIINTLANDGGLDIISDKIAFIDSVKRLLSEPEYMAEKGNKALLTVQNNSGVLAKLKQGITEFLNHEKRI